MDCKKKVEDYVTKTDSGYSPGYVEEVDKKVMRLTAIVGALLQTLEDKSTLNEVEVENILETFSW